VLFNFSIIVLHIRFTIDINIVVIKINSFLHHDTGFAIAVTKLKLSC